MPYTITVNNTDELHVLLRIGGVDLSSHYENVLNFVLLEEAGTRLPAVEMQVKSTNKRVLGLINEGNPLELTIGLKGGELETTKFILQRPVISNIGADAWLIRANGIKATYVNWAKPRVEISSEMSGIERIIEVARRSGENIITNVDKSEDKQRWVQYGCPDKLHIDDIWPHCDLGDGFPALACGVDGFIVKDIKRLVDQDTPKFKFGNIGKDYIRYDYMPSVEHMGGFFANVGARGISRPIYDLEKGEQNMVESNPKSFLSLGDPPFDDTFAKISDVRKTLTRNMHPNYWKSHAHNTTQLALCSSLRISLTWKHRYITTKGEDRGRKIRPLDLVSIKSEDIEIKEKDSAVEAFSGNYVVSKVLHNIVGNTLSTTCQLVREYFNSSEKKG